MSGHSKWAQIKHKKAITDAKKSRVFSKYAREIAVAAREGGPDPELNAKLKTIIESAKRANMPSNNIERLLNKNTREEGEDRFEELVLEAYGPINTAFMLKTITDNKNRTVAELRNILAKNGGKLAAEGSVAWMFRLLGKITVAAVQSSKERIEMAAIEQAAEDIAEENGIIAIFTKPEKLYQTKEVLACEGFSAESASLEYVPINPIAIADETAQKKLESFMETLGDHDDVQEIYSNTE